MPPALAALADKVHGQAYRVTDEEIAALVAEHGEDTVFEFVVAAALGAARARLDAGLRALGAAGAPASATGGGR